MTNTVEIWKKYARELKHHDHQSKLSKKIYDNIRNCKPNQSITIALTVEELETILEL